MFETCDWEDEDVTSGPVMSEEGKMSCTREKETTSRKKRLKRNLHLLEVLRSLNTPSAVIPDLPPPPEATPPKRPRKSAPDVMSPESSPEDECPLQDTERLSRRQWRNKLKNKRRNRNKFKVVTGRDRQQGAPAGDQGAGTPSEVEETPPNPNRKEKQNGKVLPDKGAESPSPTGPQGKQPGAGGHSSQPVTPRDRARLQKLRKMMQCQTGAKRTESPDQEETDPHTKGQQEAENHRTETPDQEETDPHPKEAGRDRSAELRSRMEQKLNSARFRYINQQLYTSSSQDAHRLFLQDPQAFTLYHSGFSQQLQRWPVNPITQIIKYIKNRSPSLVVADFGCGDALLARSVRNKVHSFDLVALNDWVTVCDIAEVPLQDASVDVGVFCLSLMGTNVSDFLEEANRVLKPGGVLLVAEVSSRFDDVRQFLSAMSQLGFKALHKNTENSHFYLFEFSKTGRARNATSHPGLQLRPCLYKKR
ncbi:ribosomal RNA-processing protein 8 [Dendropsophus ebraccatus]|uniref:ribosomal RNA-processing protein 8 n=1 Tax=Dendropsophus ebraccatus TaxID=150705 RepID=UPI003831828E